MCSPSEIFEPLIGALLGFLLCFEARIYLPKSPIVDAEGTGDKAFRSKSLTQLASTMMTGMCSPAGADAFLAQLLEQGIDANECTTIGVRA